MDKNRQGRAPFVEALEAYVHRQMMPFHTPGHKMGKGASCYQKHLFGGALARDLGLMYALDDLFQPEGPLRESMQLASDLYGADRTFFSINGTTACVQAMILAVCRCGEEILIPRESHSCVMSSLIMSGAVPVYMESRFAQKEQISLGPDMDSLQKALDKHPQAKAVLFTYPTYDGIACNLRDMAAYAHNKGLVVLVDEAHGAHLPFHEDLPDTALSCGADCVAQSTHKLAGSLTQTSMLHCRKGFSGTGKVAVAMTLVQSTSPNYWFLASLDSARCQLALQGTELVGSAVELARELRNQLNNIEGIVSFGKEILSYPCVSGFDETKITIDFSRIGFSGRQAELLLRQQGIEVEMTAGNHVLALITIGDDKRSIASLLRACQKIACGKRQKTIDMKEPSLPHPEIVISPQKAWNGQVEAVPLTESEGRIAAETITFYPPGIPVISLGERVTKECLVYIIDKLTYGYIPHGGSDKTLQTLRVLNYYDKEGR